MGGSLGSMLFPESTPKKKRRNNKENEPPLDSSPQASPGAGSAAGEDGGFTNQSMSIIPSSLSLAATAMTSLAAKSAARAAASKKKADSVENPQPSTSKAAAAMDEAPRDPFAPEAMGSKHGKGTKGLKGRAKVRNRIDSVQFPLHFISFLLPRPAPWKLQPKPPPTKRPGSSKKKWKSRKRHGNTGEYKGIP